MAQELRVGTNPKMRCTCGRCHKTAVTNQPPQSIETPTEFPAVDLLAQALAQPAPAVRTLSASERNAAIAKQNESRDVTDHAVKMGRDGKLYRNGKLVEPK
jgi:aspartyl/asparaginyl beta-hydroxylase (cupin superfamily)